MTQVVEDDQGIDPELWLQYMLLLSGDEEQRLKVVERISQNTGFPPEKVEIILKALMETLLQKSRSN